MRNSRKKYGQVSYMATEKLKLCEETTVIILPLNFLTHKHACAPTHTPENRCKLKFNTRSTCTELHFQTTITKAQPCVFYVTDQELLF